MRTDKPRQLSVLLEHGTGVMEVFFVVMQNGDEIAFRPVRSIPRSGSIRATDRDTLAEALQLLKWSEEHAEVFEGYVMTDG